MVQHENILRFAWAWLAVILGIHWWNFFSLHFLIFFFNLKLKVACRSPFAIWLSNAMNDALITRLTSSITPDNILPADKEFFSESYQWVSCAWLTILMYIIDASCWTTQGYILSNFFSCRSAKANINTDLKPKIVRWGTSVHFNRHLSLESRAFPFLSVMSCRYVRRLIFLISKI